jgi:ADP-ribosylglycohydrolase
MTMLEWRTTFTKEEEDKMLGAIIGDIAGSVYEWNNIKTKDIPLYRDDCHFTDDTVMTVAVADALMKGGKPDDFIDSMKKFGRMYPNVGYGPRFSRWLFSDDREPYNSFGNGSAMRVSPVAWYFDNLDDVERFAEISASVTHNHPEGIKGAKSVAGAIFLARKGASKPEIKKYVEEKYGYDLNRTLDEIRPHYQFDVSCQGSVPEAIIAFLESSKFRDAILSAISIGGDSDTIAAITGSIAETFYGISEKIVKKARKRLDAPLLEVYGKFKTELREKDTKKYEAERNELEKLEEKARETKEYKDGMVVIMKEFEDEIAELKSENLEDGEMYFYAHDPIENRCAKESFLVDKIIKKWNGPVDGGSIA